jgi:hypothetical protein
MGEMRNVNKILVGGHEGKRTLGRPRRRWEDVKMGLKRYLLECEGKDSTPLSQDGFLWWVPLNTERNFGFHKSGIFLDQLSNYQIFMEDPVQ